MSESIADIRRRLEELEDANEALHAAGLKMVRAVTSQSFIIPNGGARRDRAIAAWDSLLAAPGPEAVRPWRPARAGRARRASGPRSPASAFQAKPAAGEGPAGS